MDDGFSLQIEPGSLTLAPRKPSVFGASYFDNETASSSNCEYARQGGLEAEQLIQMDSLCLETSVDVSNESRQRDVDVHGGVLQHTRSQKTCRREQRPTLQLPPLPSLDDVHFVGQSATLDAKTTLSESQLASLPKQHPKPHHSLSWPPYSPAGAIAFSNPFGSAAPLTPPEEFDSFKWTNSDPGTLFPRNQSLSSEQSGSRPDITVPHNSSSTARPSTISLPGFTGMSEQTTPSTWLDRAVGTISEPPISCDKFDTH